MINFYDITNGNTKEHNPNWPKIPDHPYKILVICGTASGKTNSMFSLIINQPDIDEICLYVKEPNELN